MKCDEEPGSNGCHDLMVERIRYFTGRHMTARDFRDADAYHRSFRHLHNRVLHGVGVACGLEVERHWRQECRHDRVVVRCGMAIDCCGREIVVRRDLVTGKIPWDKRPTVSDSDRPDYDYVLVLCLQYREMATEMVPVLYSTMACSSPSLENGRIRECYELAWHWVKREDLASYGWDDPVGCEPPDDEENEAADADRYEQRKPPYEPPYQPLEDEGCPDDDEHGCCLEPKCPPGHCVAIAVVLARAREEMEHADTIDTSGRRSIAQAREQLTHICWINWPHGGVVKASAMHNLRVRFDRALLVEPSPPDHPGPRGINERTFVVQFGEQSDRRQIEDLDFVAYRRAPYLKGDRRTAVYEFDKPFRSYRDHIIHVTLRCDFIVDCRKQPVDGNHLAGRLPTGDNVPGGTFESWFRVVDDADYDRNVQRYAAQGGEGQES
jgi:hypothetical protein